ncbi:MAG: ABC transporter permease [Anaerolineales bacterium]|nr:ABC transporter permease [Anaerolineales bacterium]
MLNQNTAPEPAARRKEFQHTLLRVLDIMSTPALAILTAFLIGALLILLTSDGSIIDRFVTVGEAYWGMVDGALFKVRGLSETLVATVPYVLLSLAVAVGFKTGLFNIGVEGQFTIGAICAAVAGAATKDLPGILHLPLALIAGALGGAAWAAGPAFLKARTGAHEVISTMMMNYVAFRFAEYLISGPLVDPLASTIQTSHVSTEAELWIFAAVPQRLQDPLNALAVALVVWLVVALIVRSAISRESPTGRIKTSTQRRAAYLGAGFGAGLLTFIFLPRLVNLWWPFSDQYDRLHIGLFLALGSVFFIRWLMGKTTLGFELRTVGANPSAAQYAGVNITRNIMLSMTISGALAGLAGTVEVLGVSICRCLPLFFSSGYGWDSIGIALLAQNDPFGILAASTLFGAMRNGADLMELRSGVSKYLYSLIQALVLLFVAAPTVVRSLYRIRTKRKDDNQAPVTAGEGAKQ